MKNKINITYVFANDVAGSYLDEGEKQALVVRGSTIPTTSTREKVELQDELDSLPMNYVYDSVKAPARSNRKRKDDDAEAAARLKTKPREAGPITIDPSQLVRVQTAAKMRNVHRQAMYYHVTNKRLPYLVIDDVVFVWKSDVMNLKLRAPSGRA